MRSRATFFFTTGAKVRHRSWRAPCAPLSTPKSADGRATCSLRGDARAIVLKQPDAHLIRPAALLVHRTVRAHAAGNRRRALGLPIPRRLGGFGVAMAFLNLRPATMACSNAANALVYSRFRFACCLQLPGRTGRELGFP